MKIELTKGKYADVSSKDYKLVNQYSWYAYKNNNTWYAARRVYTGIGKQQKVESMHRLIMGFPKELIDHKDRDGLNNKRSNLRVANKSINALNSKMRVDNTSGIRGLNYHKSRNMWRVYSTLNGKTNTKWFKDEIEARNYVKPKEPR